MLSRAGPSRARLLEGRKVSIIHARNNQGAVVRGLRLRAILDARETDYLRVRMSQSGFGISIREKLRAALKLAAAYLDPLVGDFGKTFSPKKIAAAALLVFGVAAGVRLLHLDDITKNPGGWDPMVPNGGVYIREAERTRNAGFMPRNTNPNSHAARLLHPPGYVLYLIGLFKLMGWEDRHGVMIAQGILDSVVAALALIFTAWVTNLRTGLLTGLLIAISPHHARTSLFVSPESMFVLPVILAVCCLYLANRRGHRMRYYVCAGLLLGLACWLRSNGLLMSPFFAVIAVAAARERAVALKGVLVMLLFTVAAILPITIRNYVITRRFIPLTVGLGIIMTQAIADYDFDMKYGLPKHPDLPMKEAEWYNRPDYARHFLRPDGIERDNARVWRTLDVIKRHPGYYLSTVARRMDFMLRCDRQAGPDDWPFNTANPIWVSKHTMFGHGAPEQLSGREVFSMDGARLAEHFNTAGEGRVWLSTDESSGTPAALLTASAADDNKELLSVPSIELNRRTDYVLTVEATVDSGSITALVIGDRDNRELGAKTLGRPGEADADVHLPFASQDNASVRLTLTNNRVGQEAGSISIRSIRLIEIGATPYSWSDHFRWAVRGLQRNLYATPAMRALWIIGLAVLLLGGRRQEALWIAAVPVYYLLFQSLLHTEYRYIIPIHYFLIAFAAVGLHTLVQMLVDAFRRVRGASRA